MTVFPLAQSSVMFVMSQYLTQVQINAFLRDYLKHSAQVKSEQRLAHYKVKTQVTAHTLSEKTKQKRDCCFTCKHIPIIFLIPGCLSPSETESGNIFNRQSCDFANGLNLWPISLVLWFCYAREMSYQFP